ncbi:transposable element Tcb1 transposase [Trichonephila clavipes]|nr:transposable element Tcb1 transposase [Trichonephila clavipes]
MRGRIIGKIKEGRKITDVARVFDIAHSVVSRLKKSFKTTGMCSRRHGGGRVLSTTPAEDRYIVLSAKRNRRTTAQQVANQFFAASGKQISRKTVARRLRGAGLCARRPVVCVPLTRQHRTARLQWCREHHNWTEQDWACVLFSGESRFSLSSDCRRQLIWRESGTAYRPENIKEKDRYPTCSIMVWAGIMDCLDREGIQRLVWPARSPDLNPIENLWDALGSQVAGQNYPPTNKNTLIRALTEEWDKLPQHLLDNVVQSMYYDIKDISESDLEVIEADIQSTEERLEELEDLLLLNIILKKIDRETCKPFEQSIDLNQIPELDTFMFLEKRSQTVDKLIVFLPLLINKNKFLYNSRNPSVKRSGQLAYSEVNEAELGLIKNLQASAF